MIEFEWDAEKSAKNIQNHGISFEEAATVFDDDAAAIYEDPDHSATERRYLVIGTSDRGRLLIIAHADRDERIRIINARKVTRQERKMYEEEDR